jgi:hypothetical protein
VGQIRLSRAEASDNSSDLKKDPNGKRRQTDGHQNNAGKQKYHAPH